MEYAEERLIKEVGLWKRVGDYCPWPHRRAADVPQEVVTIKSRLRRIWLAGDYDRLARYMEGNAEAFYRRLSVPLGSRLLDVGCGSGQLALIASRSGVDATGVDIAEDLVERARERSRVEGLRAHFHLADAEALPFPDASFDVVTTLLGAMFAPRPEIVASELMRVCRPGGMIAMANWTPQGFVGRMFELVSQFVSPSGMPPPVLWGEEAAVRERFGTGVSSMLLTRRQAELSFPFPPSEVVRFFRAHHGPTNRAFASRNRAGRKSLQAELEALWSSHNLARGGFTKVDSEWLEVIALRA
jgi:SAM-dependent methyltransferase